MNQLSRSILINSAAVPYQELDLRGNIHIIGKNGTGKSSILRVILFFYTANTQKLGLKPNQKSFVDFYLPSANSWLIYEVTGSLGPFCVAAFRHQNRVAYRFVNGAYEREIYLDEHGSARLPKDMLAQVAARKLDHSRLIERYEDYRALLFGTYNGPEKTSYRKYALFEGQNYEHVWRTLANIFLNARLESQFIKRTLIDSITDQDFSIDLSVIEQQLREFEDNRRDIETFRTQRRQPQRIVALYGEWLTRQANHQLLAQRLGAVVQHAQAETLRIGHQLEQQMRQRQELRARLDTLRRGFEQDNDAQNKLIGRWEGELKKAREKRQYYQDQQIDERMADERRRAPLEQELQSRKADLGALLSQFADLEQQFALRFQALDNEAARFHLGQETHLNQAMRAHYETVGALRRETDTQIAALELQAAAQVREENQRLGEAQQELDRLRDEAARVQHQPLKLAEIDAARQQLAAEERRQVELKADIRLAQERIGQLEAARDRELAALDEQRSQAEQQLRAAEQARQERLAFLDKRLKELPGSLYNWLEGHYADWQRSIGKVCREEVLFHSYLSPRIDRLNELLFGIRIDLDELEEHTWGPEVFQQEKEALEAASAKARRDFVELGQQLERDKIACEKRYKQQKIRPLAQQVKDSENALEQSRLSARKQHLLADRLHQEAKQLREQALLQLSYAQQRQTDVVQAARAALAALQTRIEAHKQQLREALDTRISASEASLETLRQQTQADWQDFDDRLQQRRRALEAEQSAALAGRGADSAVLEALRSRIAEIEADLRSLDAHRKLLIAYEHDKAAYIDQIPYFEQELAAQQQTLAALRGAYEQQAQALRGQLDILDREVEDTRRADTQWKHELDLWTATAQTPLFRDVSVWFGSAAADHEGILPSQLVQQIQVNAQEQQETGEQLRKACVQFLRDFRAGNIFDFPLNLQAWEAYFEFAEKLKTFLEDKRIDDYEREVAAQYAQFVTKIAEEVGALTAREDDIAQLINRINRSFRSGNFVGVVKDIQLKMDESANRIVAVLKEIRAFADEQGHRLGGFNLFNQENPSEQNKKAFALLTALSASLRESRVEALKLEDTFQLSFRVRENQNDTGWVENLSSVGSNGTDVLVKAMIYITLLSVFKERASKHRQDFRLHCIIDEVGILDASYLQDLITFANEKNISLINGSPNESTPLAYHHLYKLSRDKEDRVRVHRLISRETETV
ncbi:MAG: ATP-binding protein [Bacteroidia bacterium]